MEAREPSGTLSLDGASACRAVRSRRMQPAPLEEQSCFRFPHPFAVGRLSDHAQWGGPDWQREVSLSVRPSLVGEWLFVEDGPQALPVGEMTVHEVCEPIVVVRLKQMDELVDY